MPVTYAARHVLEDHISGFEAAPNPHHLSILRSTVVISALAHAGHEADIEEALTNLEDTHLRFCAPGEWLVISDSVSAETIERYLRDLGPRLSFVDQSDGRVVLAIRGPRVRSILAKCTALDLHPDVFAIGQSASCQICHVAANLARTGQDRFEIIVMRSFAGFLFDEICEMGREFALTAGFA